MKFLNNPRLQLAGKLTMVLLLIVTLLTACSKNKEAVPKTVSIEGKWQMGKQNAD